MTDLSADKRLRVVKLLLVGFVVSGITAFPLNVEIQSLAQWLGARPGSAPEEFQGLTRWIVTVRNAVIVTDSQYPFLA